MAKKGTLRDRVESEERAVIGIHNDTLVCKDCLLRYDDSVKLGNMSKCEAYPDMKPMAVINGGECTEYIKE